MIKYFLTLFPHSTLLWLTLSLTGCGSPDYIDTLPFAKQESAQEMIDNLKINCQGNCPEAVGGMTTLNTTYSYPFIHYQVGLCSVGLLAHNRILTNEHCLGHDNKFVGASCSNMTVIFPATQNKPSTRVTCDRVIAFSNKSRSTKNVSRPDWAILELSQSVDRKPFTIDLKNGIPNQSSLLAYPVYYEKQKSFSRGYKQTHITGTIKKVSCQSSMTLPLASEYIHSKSPLFSASCDHDIVGGNSGTTLLSMSEQVKGVISMAVNPKENKVSLLTSEKFPLPLNMAGGTNAHCIPALNSLILLSSQCDYNSDDNQHLLTSLFMGQEVPPSLLDETILEIEEAHPFANWTTQHNPDFAKPSLSDFKSPYVAKHSADEFLKQMLQVRLPLTPICIAESQKKQPQVQIKIPYFYASQTDFSFNNKGEFKIGSKRLDLEFSFQYSESTNSFIGSVPEDLLIAYSHPDKQLYKKIDSKKYRALSKCLNLENYSSSHCNDYREITSSLTSFFQNVDPVIKDHLHFNLINDLGLFNFTESTSLTLPVCK